MHEDTEETGMQRREWMAWAGAGLLAGPALAQADYPKAGTTLRYIVPFPPGGLTDVMARQVGQQLGTRWGLNLVVDNKPGNGGQIGADAAAKSPGDGYHLLAITLTHAANVTLFKGRAPYDFQRDLKPVALLAGSPMLVVVPAASPIKDFKDLMAQARQRKLNAGSSGNGTPPHLTLALFADTLKVEVQHVPYKGGAPSMTDLIGGQLDVIFSNFPESIAHVKSGRLRALAIASAERHPLVPEVPTTAEAGMPQLAVENWTAIMVPSATPDGLVARLGAEVLAIMAGAEIAERARTQGFRVDARGPKDFAPFLKDEIDRWGRIIAAARIQAD
jgi:tripartite-type tricarboxylate transporter receptor subunit TctC